ncbi:glutathione ABC transporter substrate-binding protein [Cytobacillus kochii]|uniref:glutathione ABC transporter substrate-binding protein n=1 Tax=Cytobacillus kochii TaxID=859143 RepID=UPI0021E5FEBF
MIETIYLYHTLGGIGLRRKIKELGLLLFILVVISGCSTSNNVTLESNDSKNGNGNEGTLIIARQSDVDNLDHHFMSTINAASVTHGKVYEGLVARDKNENIVPLLAESWEQVNDTTWEFHLQHGVTFHDGTPFNADAVKETFERVLDPDLGAPKASAFEMVEEIKVLDDYTVQFKLSEPFSPLLSILASHEGGIINPKTIEKYKGEVIKEPNGTGPFTFESWTPGQAIILNKNQNYWGNPPHIDRVEFKVVPEETTRVSMIETGEAHIAEPLSIHMIETVETSKKGNVYRSEGFGTEYLGFNMQALPFNDVQVRKAISHAIEMDAIIDGAFNKIGHRANSLMGSKVFGYHEDLKAYEYNLNEAKRLLSAAGYANGFEATLLTMDNKERINLAEILQSQLMGIGIKLNIQVLEYGSFVEQVNKGDSQLFLISWRNATGDADYNQYNLFHSSSHGATGNTLFYSNNEVDELIELARAETDQEKRLELYAKAQEIEMEDAAYVPVRVIENLAAVAKNVDHFSISAAGYLEINDILINKD